MPHIITTIPREWVDYARQYGTDEAVERSHMPKIPRRAVATPEQARDEASEAVDRAFKAHHAGPEVWERAFTACRELDEDGGTVGPLPDGTVIEVAPITWAEIVAVTGWLGWEGLDAAMLVTAEEEIRQEILDAYNAVLRRLIPSEENKMPRYFALLSEQGTACLETVLTEDEYGDPARRRAVDSRARRTVAGPDAPVPDTWTDVTDNDAVQEAMS